MKYKVTKQHYEKDCGAACISTIAGYYGYETDFHNYVRMTDTDKSGTNMSALVESAKKLGFSADGLEGSWEELLEGVKNREIHLPFIAHIITPGNLLHFVVVFELDEEKCIIGDPAQGIETLSAKDFAQQWTGAMVDLVPTKTFKKGKFGGAKKKLIKNIFAPNKKTLVSVIVLSVIAIMMGILGTFIFQTTIDGFGATEHSDDYSHIHSTAMEEALCDDEGCSDDYSIEDSNNYIDYVLVKFVVVANRAANKINVTNVNFIFALLLLLYLICSLVHYVRGKLLIVLGKNVDGYLGKRYYERIVDLSISSAAEKKTGEYLARFSDLSKIRNAISGATVAIILDAVMVVFCGLLLFIYNKELFFIALSLIVFYTIIAILFKKPLELANRKSMESNAIFDAYFKESIEGKELINTSCAQGYVKKSLAARFHKFIDTMVHNRKVELTQETICNAIESVGMVVILWVGFLLVKSEVLTVGALITFYMLKGYFTEPIKNIISLQPTIQTALVALDRLTDILDMDVEENVSEENDVYVESEWNELIVDHLSYEYRNRDTIINDLSLTVKKGEKIALVGESGCGKTTLAKLLMGLLTPTDGEISRDDISYERISKDVIRKCIAYVSQNMFFFTDSVRNNLRLGNDKVTDEEILEACKLCQLEGFINDLPFGLDTPIDENGSNLSAGQKQRLSLVRALLRKPQILIMDEITSNLDTITERAIRDYIFSQNDMTCIIIAHRLATISKCDKIYVIEKGKVIDCGNHDELANRNGLYREMLMAQ